MKGPGSKPSLLFQLVVPATALFIVTILSLIAVLFSDERAPLARWLNRHGNSLLAAELVVIIVLSILAMAVDRRAMLAASATNSITGDQAPGAKGETLPSDRDSAEGAAH